MRLLQNNRKSVLYFLDRIFRTVIVLLFGSMTLLAIYAPLIQHFNHYPAGEEIYSLFRPICHQYPTRSFWIFGLPFALCARCSSGYLGVVLAAAFLKLNFKYSHRLIIGILILLVAIIDPVLQLYGYYESNNIARFVSGLSGGISVFLILYPFKYIKGEKMKRSLYILVLFIIIVSPDFFAQRKVKLSSGSLVVVKTMETYSSENMKVGQQVTLFVAMPVVVEDDTLINSGAPVFAVVQDAESSGMVGAGGEIHISFLNTIAVDGSNIPLSGNMSAKGESSTGEKVAVGVILCPLALLCSGDSADITAGMQARAFTAGDYNIKLDK